MAELPTGTVIFLLTDVEGSTALWEEVPEAMRGALARHDELVEAAVVEHGGTNVKPRGEGDSRFAVFAGAADAVPAALAVQRGPLQAYCHLGLGKLYRQIGRHEAAQVELSTTIEMFRDMEMTFWLPGAEVELEQATASRSGAQVR
jgi:hypothetical protein